MPFPLPFVPKLSYKTGGRKFGAPRDGGLRKHAGCDLIAPRGTEIFAIEDGHVVESARHFHRGTWQLAIRHSVGVIRYCEIEEEPFIRQFERGTVVRAGQLIAHVGKMYRDSMLHFEFYKGTVAGPLTVRSNAGFQRRSDLADPASLLDKLARNLRPASSAEAGAEMVAAVMGRVPG